MGDDQTVSTTPTAPHTPRPTSTGPTTAELVVPDRFCGPPTSGNGGWTAGALAELVRPHVDHLPRWRCVEVTLTAPPPLEVAMSATCEDGGVVVRHHDLVVARGTLVTDALIAVPPIAPAQARELSATYPGHTAHPFPSCFVCGPERGDGLRIFPGPVQRLGPRWWAATWTPDATLAEDRHPGHPRASVPVTWAALDCIGGWAGDLSERTMVLGRMSARVDSLPVLGEEHVLVGEARGQEGRKVHAATSLYDAAGALVATAEQVWIVLDPKPGA